MAQQITADPELFPSIAYYYESQCNDLMLIKEFVVANCTLDDAFGLLLSIMKPQYEDARDKTISAMTSITELLRDLASKVDDYAVELDEDEAEISSQLSQLEARVAELEAAAATQASASAASSAAGGGGGGGYSGPGGNVTAGVAAETPAPETPAPETSDVDTSGDDNTNDGDDDGDTIVNITIDGDNNTVTVGEDGEVEVEPTDETAPVPETTPVSPSADEAVGAAPVSDIPSTEPPVAVVLDPAVVEAEDAQRAEFYDQLWEEQAAKDPLGRSADELRLAWEAREPIELDLSTETPAVGYGESLPAAIPVDFGLLAAVDSPSATLIGAPA